MALIAVEGLRVVVNCSRRFSISSVQRDLDTQGRFLKRLLSEKLERKIQDAPQAKSTFKLLDKKRSAVLSNLYMQNVSQILAFGGFRELEGKGIQLTHVAVKNTGFVEVFWTASENEDPLQIEDILSSISSKVRNQLMYGSMLGNVPHIIFKRDLSAVNMNDTMQVLHKISLEMEAMKKNAKSANLSLESTDAEIEPVAPLMRMDALGLPHDKIYRRIKEAKKHSYPLQVPEPPTPEEFNNLVQPDMGSKALSPDDQIRKRKELRKFITLYQKSTLNSSTRKKNLQDRSNNIFYYEDTENDESEEYVR
ncbi:uncharacterized protein LOC117648218 [Thrips palmi]|uniref:Uncharacterized protein LOC117648218 n=1 Tax=Thrips palmi TaxID=161013 RepID=A0A6P8Z8A5_THRPL|nr:uncharacterized protein LOC117648218 [Thrips palmi]